MYELGPVATTVGDVARGVTDDQLGGATPCDDYTVAEVLGHLVGLTAAFTAAARKDLGPLTGTAPGSVRPELPDDWRDRLPRQLAALAEAWREPGAWEGQTQAGGLMLGGGEAGFVALNELVMHGWDLARATGRPFPCDEAAAEVALAFASMLDDDNRGDAFGPAVPVPEQTSTLDRALALSGRDPSWTP